MKNPFIELCGCMCLTLLAPKWLLLDEPFANIDDASARMIAGKLKELNRPTQLVEIEMQALIGAKL